MLRTRSLTLVALLGFCSLWGLPAAADEGASSHTTPFQLSLADPLQIVPASWSVTGLRLGILYADNHDVTGVDLGFANRTEGDQRGLQSGLYNEVNGRLVGVQLSVAASDVDGEARGLQLAVGFNAAKRVVGGQMSIMVNRAAQVRGLQIGLVNLAGEVDGGLQIGLLNMNKKGLLPVLPFFNWGF